MTARSLGGAGPGRARPRRRLAALWAPSRWRPRTLVALALLAGGGLAAARGLASVWASPPWFARSRQARCSCSSSRRFRVTLALLAGAAWLALCRAVTFDSVGRWLFDNGSREAVTTIRPASRSGPVFDIYRVTDGRPLLAVRRGPWSELVHEAEEEGDFADYVDLVVRGHHLVFHPGGASRERSAEIDGRPAIVESR